MAKKVSTSFKKSADNRRTDVLPENIDKKFNQVLEGHTALDKKIDDFRHETRAELKFIRFAQDVLKNEMGDFRTDVGVLRTDISDLKSSMNQVMEYLKRIDDEIQELKSRFYSKADLERVERLEHRVAQVELVVKKIYGKSKS